eukprot:CAMPEP_0180422048 /NCGR_PEP_ID=MMETSP1036_2-20121128/3474_1 /TAXON_ID=632150 /ORGANISM="Azadinium spinosum, Strain 3D9" /LENGTH=285 /DNA_ID=CAMNT_0022427349 /DNA_START=228 /DNA_END=1083 /DNA_ORIENTATION=+
MSRANHSMHSSSSSYFLNFACMSNWLEVAAEQSEEADQEVGPMQRILVVAMEWMEQAHLAPQAVGGIPPVEVAHNAQLLRQVLRHKLQCHHPAQQLPAVNIEVEAAKHQPYGEERNRQEEARCIQHVAEDPVMLPAVPLVEVLPTALKAALLLLVDVLKVLYSGVHHINVDLSGLRDFDFIFSEPVQLVPFAYLFVSTVHLLPVPCTGGRTSPLCTAAQGSAALARCHRGLPARFRVWRQGLDSQEERRRLGAALEAESLVGRNDVVEVWTLSSPAAPGKVSTPE